MFRIRRSRCLAPIDLACELLYRRAMKSCLWALALASICLLASARALAQSTDAEFAETSAAAVREYEGGNYAEAYALFLRLHEARPSARTERALGGVAFELRRYTESVTWLEAALADARNPLDAETRTEVEGVLRRARAFVGRITLVVRGAGADRAQITIDGRATEERAVTLDLGEHEIEVRAEGAEPITRRISVGRGEAQSVELTLLARTRDVVVVTERDDPGATMRTLGFVAVGVGGALLIGGVVATAIWSDSVGTLNANLRLGACTADPSTEAVLSGAAECFDQESRYKLARTLAWGGYMAGAALIGVGIALIVGAPSRPDTPTAASVSCGPFAGLGVACSGSF